MTAETARTRRTAEKTAPVVGPARGWPADSVARRPVASLLPYARNARTHSDEQVAQIAASVLEWGWTSPVLVDEARPLTAEDLADLGWRPWLFGASLAWRRAVYTEFPRLAAAYLPIGHDTLVPFRGAVLGGLAYLPEPLLRYRRHPRQWSHQLHDHSAPEAWRESQYSAAMMPRLAMERDLRHLLAQPHRAAPAERDRLAALHQRVVARILLLNAEWVGVRQTLYRQGWRPTWVRRETFAQTGRLHGLGALRETGRNLYRRLRWQLFRR